MIFVAVDIGGTFTDLIGFDDAGQAFVQAKSLTTPHELTQGVINCIRESGIDAARIDELIHGSTTAINTLIERKGAKTGAGGDARNARRLHHRPRQPAGGVQSVLSPPQAAGVAAAHPRGGGAAPGRRRGRHAAEQGEHCGGLQGAEGRGRRGGGGVLPARLRQSGARAGGRRDDQEGDARRVPVAVARHPARVPRVRADVDHGGERLHRAEGRRLCEGPAVGPGRHRISRAISRSCAPTAA